MIIQSMDLENFRNYKTLHLEFDEGTNILYGNNAQGKTNILEAVYLSGTTKSHKGSKDRDVIAFHQEESHIRTIIRRNDISYRIDMHLKKNKTKGIAINGIPIKRASELFGIVNYVFFSPEDLNIIKNGPAERRRFMDLELCQLDKSYLFDLTNYNRALNQRNRLLKDLWARPELKDTLFLWDEKLAEFGSKIIKRRMEFMDHLGPIVERIHGQLSGEKEKCRLVYEPNISVNAFREQLKRNLEKDMKFKLTSIGPHRDDLLFQIGGIDIRRFGSQGQQRTCALSLKLAEIELVKEMIHDTPILLLDDVLSELDSNRQNYLLNSIHQIQTLITCTGLDDFVNHRFEIDRVFQVVDGVVYT